MRLPLFFRPALLIAVSLAGICPGLDSSADAADICTSTNYLVGAEIPDNNVNGLASTKIFSSPVGIVTDVNVTLKTTGGYNGDLYVYLVHESGFSVLLNRAGRTGSDAFGYGDAGFDLTFDDQADSDVHLYRFSLFGNATTPLGGALTNSWMPDGRAADPFTVLDTDTRTELLTSFNGLNPNGSWTLFAADLSPVDAATLDSWGLAICGMLPIPAAITAQSGDQSIECTSNLTLSAAIAGTGPFTNQWYNNGIAIPNATNTSLPLVNLHSADSGPYTLVVCNMAGCATSAPIALTVTDTMPPLILCPANLVVNTSGGDCASNVTFAASASDGCSAVTTSCVPPSGSSFAKGVTTVTCTAMDTSGNTNACTFTITVNDTEVPAVACPANIVVSTSGGSCASNVTFAASATDNCPGVTTNCVPASGSSFAKGVTTVTCTAMDTSGNTNACTFTITVNDTEDPAVACPANIVVSTSGGSCASNVTFAASATDNCPGVTTNCVPASGSSFAMGVTTVTCTATDTNGNTNACTFTITVNDTEDPAVACPANIVVSTSGGSCASNVTFAASATDNCPGVTTNCVPASGSSFAMGVTTVTCTATDTNGNTNACTFTITVNDTEVPAVACPANIVVSTSGGSCASNVTFAASATDNCPGVTTNCVPASGSSFAMGVTTVTCTATDTNGNTNACTFTITVNDTEVPAVACPANIVVSTSGGSCASNVTFAASATDNCPGVTTNCVPASGSSFAKGVTTVTCTATDTNGNTNGCTFTITVNDTEDPAVACPANIVVSTSGGSCASNVTFAASATDNCPGVTTNCVPASGSSFAMGVTTVTCTATDTNGNTNACTFTITVNDTEVPAVACPANIVVSTSCGSCTSNVTFAASATDNCPGVTTNCVPASGSSFAMGVTMVTCTATDTSGNTNACTFVVTVNLVENANYAVNAPIPHNNPNGYASTKTVASQIGSLTDVNVRMNISGGYNGDLYAYLVHESGYSVLLNRVGRRASDPLGYADTGFYLTFDDQAGSGDVHVYRQTLSGNPAMPLAGPLTNSWAPDGRATDPAVVLDTDTRSELLSSFNGLNPNGDWTLFIADLGPLDTAVLVSWSLDLCGLPPVPPGITVQPQSQTVQCSSNATFTVVAAGTPPLTNQWYRNGASLPGVNGASLVRSAASLANGDLYSVVVRGMGGSVTSAPAALTGIDTIAPVVVCPSNIVIECLTPEGAMVSFSPTVIESCSIGLAATCAPPSGSLFPPGLTTVFCSATDDSGNIGHCAFEVRVAEPASALRINPAGAKVLLSWPVTCAHYRLLQAPSLNPPASWTPVTAPVSISGGEYHVLQPAAGQYHFYRLVTP